MKKIASVIWAVAALATVSCQKEPGTGENGGNTAGKIPYDFDWKTVRDVSMSVDMPQTDVAVEYAVIRVYSSPMLLDGNIVAKGLVTSADRTFRTAFNLPTGVDSVFVQTTLPDGTVSVRPVQIASAQINVPGAIMEPAVRKSAFLASNEEDSMTDYPRIPEKTMTDFDSRAVISKTPASLLQLGASWWSGEYAAEAYYIPSGAEITGNIDLNGGFNPYPAPILYVAGKLKLENAGIGAATLAVLPGGEVEIATLSAQNVGKKEQPAIYVFAGGKITIGNANLSCKSAVNCGEFFVRSGLDTNNQVEFYNVAGAQLTSDDLRLSNHVTFYNDGRIVAEDLRLNTNTTVWNYANGSLEIEECEIEAGNTLYQQGTARFDELTIRGRFYVNCHTCVHEIEAERAECYIASGACLEADEASFNNSVVELASGSLFIAKEYNVSDGGQNNIFRSDVSDGDAMPVVKFEKAVCRQGAFTKFQGPMEVVYDATGLNGKYQIDDDKYFSKGAVLREKQAANIPSSECNGGLGAIEPAPEEKPEYIEVSGALYTFCFEDSWPWSGDYDLNDIVVRMSVDRHESLQGKVESIRINWEPLATGSAYNLAFAVQLDGVEAGRVASVETTNSAFGTGPFADAGLETGNDYAVIPLFNSVKEVFSVASAYINTSKGTQPAATTKYATTVTFTQPVEAEAVLESKLNAFIVVNSGKATSYERTTEVHMAGYRPTVYADVSGRNTVSVAEPYKYFVTRGNGMVDNGMMWGLMIPGTFRYPSERKDIRDAYEYFNAWAVSGGTAYDTWYKERADDSLLY